MQVYAKANSGSKQSLTQVRRTSFKEMWNKVPDVVIRWRVAHKILSCNRVHGETEACGTNVFSSETHTSRPVITYAILVLTSKSIIVKGKCVFSAFVILQVSENFSISWDLMELDLFMEANNIFDQK